MFPVILLLAWSWKDAVRWGVKRDSSNPPIPFLLAGFLVPVVAAAVVLASRFFQIG